MKLVKNNFIETAILLPIVAFLAISAYYFYISYTNYNQAQKSLDYAEYKVDLGKVLNQLGKEQGLISIYFGKDGKTDFKQIEKQWKHTDAAVDELHNFVMEKSSYALSAKPIFEALNTMREERLKISVLNTSLIDLYFKDALSKPSQIIVNELQSLDKKYMLSDTIASLLDIYGSMTSFRENSNAERALVSYFISRSLPIESSELEFWDKQIAKNYIPDYSHLEQQDAISEFIDTELYHNLENTLLTERIAVLTNSDNGIFTTKLKKWYDLQSSKIALLGEVQASIFDTVKININQHMKTEKSVMTIAIIVILISLLLAVVVRNIFSGMARDTQNLENILDNIYTDSDAENEYHLKEMIAKQDKAEIYQFLEKIIHESKESKLIAEKANETKSLFLANMSHEIRTPLNGIVGFTNLLSTSNLNSEQEEFVTIIEKSSENLLSVINDILDLSKIESENIDIEEIAFDPIIEFESGIEAYAAKVSEKNIDLGFYIDPTLSNKLEGDSNKIKQVLVNLISNAVKFTPDGGHIDILIEKLESSKGKATIRFSVKDSGIGVTEEQKTKIFKAFSQADSSTNRKYGGTGLGLTISARLVELMDGSLELESEYGKGATFFFTLKLEEIPSLTEVETFDNINIGYYLPRNHTAKPSSQYVEKYITALSDHSTIFDTIQSLTSLETKEQPDLLIVDYDHINASDLTRLSTLKSKISLLTTVSKKDEIRALDVDIYKILYSPINFSKIKKSLLDFSDTGTKIINESQKNKFTNLKALVAEDNVINQKLIQYTLENIGIDVTLADNGKEAFELRTTQVYDIIFMDIQMPVMNGVEATHAILAYEKEQEISHIPIIALTANALKGDEERFLSEGMDHYVSKPINLDAIENILELYFSDKLVTDNSSLDITLTGDLEIILPSDLDTQLTPKKESNDILLCKEKNADMFIFDTLLRKIGYSVDGAKDIKELKEMLQTKNYTYVLLDKNLPGLSEDNEISQMMKELSVLSILFVENIHYVTKFDRKKYTNVVLNIANIQFLRNIIMKLNPQQYDEYTA
ncbi:MAG: hypothetical protein DRG30_03440 [Epsilonproteobacteria bacterium]|nr:MAG: hypothetical protein DRG30_03440 [Campylobacterota bacterium]